MITIVALVVVAPEFVWFSWVDVDCSSEFVVYDCDVVFFCVEMLKSKAGIVH